jgi:hypothetical protein
MNGARWLRRWCLVLAAGFIPSYLAAQAATITGTETVFKTGVIDLREGTQIRHSGARGPDRPYTPRDLQVGSIFITAGNEARKVTAIYQERGRTVIETTKPRIEEVFDTFEIPDQTVAFTRENIVPSSLRPGVTVASSSRGPSRSVLPTGSDWLDTDPRWVGSSEIHTFDIDVPLLSGDTSDDAEAEEPKGENDEKTKKKNEINSKVVEASGSVDGEVRLKGTLRIAGPVLKAGVKMPEIKVSWVKVWWHIGYPKFEFKPGYIHASFDAAEQLDAKLFGKIHLTSEVRVPLAGYAAQDSGGSNSFAIGLYLKITIDGTITFGFEIAEYADINLWGTVSLVWPFIPTGISTGSDRVYFNTAVRPYVAAEVQSTAGAFIGCEATILGLNIFSAEAGGGIYADASGSLESKSVIGYNTGSGSYGSLASWLYAISFEMGAFLTADISFAVWDLNILDYRWPFLKIELEGEI